MKSIITWAFTAIQNPVPNPDLSSIPARPWGKLRLSPEQLFAVIHAPVLAEWALLVTRRVRKPSLLRSPGGRPLTFPDQYILLMAVVQITQRTLKGKLVTILKAQYWERRAALGLLPYQFFFLARAALQIRLGSVTSKELIVDSTLLGAWWKADPGAAWQQYAGKAHVFGYKVHTVLCRQANLPVFVLVPPANVHDSLVAWLILLYAATHGLSAWLLNLL